MVSQLSKIVSLNYKRLLVLLIFGTIGCLILRLPFMCAIRHSDSDFVIAFAQPFRPLAWIFECDFGTADYTGENNSSVVAGFLVSGFLAFFTYPIMTLFLVLHSVAAWRATGKDALPWRQEVTKVFKVNDVSQN